MIKLKPSTQRRLHTQLLFTIVAIATVCPAFSQELDQDYPDQVSVVRMNKGFAQSSGLNPLTSTNLQGSLVWMGFTDKDNQVLSKEAMQSNTPVFQIVDHKLQGDIEVSNYSLSSPAMVKNKFVGAPAFRGRMNDIFFRIYVNESEYVKYDIYKMNLGDMTAHETKGFGYLNQNFSVSPDGSALAYYSSPAYYSTPSYIVILKDKIQIVAKDQPEGFSWTSDDQLLFTKFPKGYEFGKNYNDNYGYPDIYESDVKGNITLVKEGGYRPMMNESKKWLSYIGPDASPIEQNGNGKEPRFDASSVNKMAVFAYDLGKKKSFFVKKIYEKFPEMVWVGDKLYILENFYSYTKSMAYCRVSEFDASSKTTRVLSLLEQKGKSTEGTKNEKDFTPFFKFIAVANKKNLLLQVPIRVEGTQNYHLLSVSISDGERSDIYSFTALPPLSYKETGYVDWFEPNN